MITEDIRDTHEGLRGRLIQLEKAMTQQFESALPSVALVHFENEVDNDVFKKSITNLLENGVECFCISGVNASLLEDVVDDVIINGDYEKVSLFKRKSIPTSLHADESVDEIALFIETQVRLNKLNPIINVIHDAPSTTLSEWKKVLNVA